MEPFRVTKEAVAALGDEVLREMLIRLLEAEACNRGPYTLVKRLRGTIFDLRPKLALGPA